MTPYTILIYPDPRLFFESVEIMQLEFNDELKLMVERLFITLKFSQGIALAAPQVNIQKRIIVIAFDEYNLTLINPVILNRSNGFTGIMEGCLSVPNVKGYVRRNKSIEIRYQNIDGTYSLLNATGLLSICIQHEIDHLNGVIYLNRMSGIKRILLLMKYKNN